MSLTGCIREPTRHAPVASSPEYGGTIQILSTLTATNAIATINAPLIIQGGGGTYTFANNSANGSGAGAGTLNIGGGRRGLRSAAGGRLWKAIRTDIGFTANSLCPNFGFGSKNSLTHSKRPTAAHREAERVDSRIRIG